MSASLRITDGWTERVGFAGSKWRGAIEMVVRPYAGYTSAFEWSRVQRAMESGADPTPIMCEQIADRVAELTVNGKAWPKDGDGNLVPESLRELRAREFETVAFCVLGRLDAEYMLIQDPDKPESYIKAPYPSAAEREGN